MKVKVISKLDGYLELIKEEQGIEVTKAWLSRKINADPSQLYRWSKNEDDGFINTAPNVGYALLIAQILKCKVEDLFEVELVPDRNDLNLFFGDKK